MNGNTTLADLKVLVPVGKKDQAVDDGPIYTVDGCGGTNTRFANSGQISTNASAE